MFYSLHIKHILAVLKTKKMIYDVFHTLTPPPRKANLLKKLSQNYFYATAI